ncbi:tachykinin-4 [Dipodomys merriami]|uniref:tachykinin-4 n=1 Tax=Dipodomys merriami TaxID=94247 RepID=UPI003855955B
MLPCLTLVFLMVLPVCIMAKDSGQKLILNTEAEPLITVTLEGGAGPSIQLQLQKAKRSKNRQFFGLMGKRVKGIPSIQPEGRTGAEDSQGSESPREGFPEEAAHPRFTGCHS